MEYTINNGKISLTVDSLGAEVHSVKTEKREYMWNGNPKYWKGHAPLLFPVVGRMDTETIKIGGKPYPMATHGFLSSTEFDVTKQCNDVLVMEASFSDETLKCYPFKFKVVATYKILEKGVLMSYDIYNLDDKTMCYGFGLHPGFQCYDNETDTIEDFYVEFNEVFSLNKPYRMPNALVDMSRRIPVIENSNRIDLKEEYFNKDALIKDNIPYTGAKLCHQDGTVLVDTKFEGFSWFNVWRFQHNPYVCLEPWSSMHGVYPFPENLEDNESTKYLDPNNAETYKMEITLGEFVN